MLFLLSPAKSLDYDTPVPEGLPATQPAFSAQAAELIDTLRAYAPQDIASLMSLSDTLAALNVARYAAWKPRHTARNARQAVLAFNGDVYEGLDARSLSHDDLAWAQDHVAILSGLYGVLRPLDWLQPYRLEMGTRLPTAHGTRQQHLPVLGPGHCRAPEHAAAGRCCAGGSEPRLAGILQGGGPQGSARPRGGMCV